MSVLKSAIDNAPDESRRFLVYRCGVFNLIHRETSGQVFFAKVDRLLNDLGTVHVITTDLMI